MYTSLAYTLENWRTGEIGVRTYPHEIFKLTLENIIELTTNYHGRILNFNELFFHLTFTVEGWNVYCTPFSRHHAITKYIVSNLVENLGINSDALARGGCPDFLLVNPKNKTFRFVEIKASEQSLNKLQVEWAKKFSYDIFIAKPAGFYEGEDKAEAEKRIVSENKMKRNPGAQIFEKYFKHVSGCIICAKFESELMQGLPVSVVLMYENGMKVQTLKRSWFRLLSEATPIEKPSLWDQGKFDSSYRAG